MWRAKIRKAAWVVASALIVLGGWFAAGKIGDAVFRDDDTDSTDIGDQMDDAGFNPDVFSECVERGGGDECMTAALDG